MSDIEKLLEIKHNKEEQKKYEEIFLKQNCPTGECFENGKDMCCLDCKLNGCDSKCWNVDPLNHDKCKLKPPFKEI